VANQLGSNPWVLDTPGAAILYATDIKNAHFEWANYASQASFVQVSDRFGKIVWSATGKADLSLVESFQIEWLYGLALTALTDGVVRLYFK
jgi:hypothetical protein